MRRVLLVCLIALTAACSTNGDSPPVTTAPPAAIEEHLSWYIGVLNDTIELNESAFDNRFHETFRTQVPYDEFAQITDSIIDQGPFDLVDVETVSPLERLADLKGTGDQTLELNLAVDPDGLIVGLFLSPAAPAPLDEPPPTIRSAIAEATGVGEVRWLAASVDGDTCTEIDGEGSDELIPIASGFKLFVLGAVVDAIETGELTWDEEVVITPSVKSLPPGELQNRTDGTTVTVREAAQLMIESSDNTAADLLISLVTRELLELSLDAWGLSEPSVDIPFLTTREVFLLKLSEPSIADDYIAADTETRRELLNELLGRSLSGLPLAEYLENPAFPDTIGWFASPLDMCTVMAKLLDAGETDPELEPLVEILTANPGVENAERWAQIAFKGGSEPGLVHTTWVMDDLDGERYAFVASVVNPDETFELAEPVALLAAGRDLVGIDGG